LEQRFVVSSFLECFHHFLFLAVVVKCEQWPSFVENFSHFEKIFLVKEHFVKSSLFFEKTLPKITAIA